ncbi:MAG: transposase [Bacilli bacterium]|nr:transposase [Bacilli bacterium]
MLFKASSITVKCWFKEKYKKQELISTYISILHTVGRSLIFNPHIHMILMDGGISNKTKQY